MTGDVRRRLGRFGISRCAASVGAIAVLAVSPAVAAFAGAQLDGVPLAVAEAVFGEPANAQDCTDRDGQPRQCTATEENAECLYAAGDRLVQCRDATPWYLEAGCYVEVAVNVTACTVELLGNVMIPIG